jgi:hypothetical protein
MSALRLTPAVIFVPMFVVGAIALLPATSANAQDSAPGAKSQSQTQAPKAAPKRNQSAPPEVTAPVSTPGCGWIGKRVIHSLLRDDAVTAQDFDRLYHTFSCSPDHLRAAFDCTVAVGALPTAAEAQTRVDSCWTDPKFDTKSTKIAPANDAPAGSGTAAGSSAQPKSGAAKSAPPASSNGTGSTPNYPAPKP